MYQWIFHNAVSDSRGDPGFGRLMHYSDPYYPGVLHYVVQLNGEKQLGWRPISERHLVPALDETGCLRLDTIDWQRASYAQHVVNQDSDWISRALHRSIDLFHDKWHYEFFRFNCEHWARLVTTGVCRCHQIEERLALVKSRHPTVGPIAARMLESITGAWEYNVYAEREIWEYLKSA